MAICLAVDLFASRKRTPRCCSRSKRFTAGSCVSFTAGFTIDSPSGEASPKDSAKKSARTHTDSLAKPSVPESGPGSSLRPRYVGDLYSHVGDHSLVVWSVPTGNFQRQTRGIDSPALSRPRNAIQDQRRLEVQLLNRHLEYQVAELLIAPHPSPYLGIGGLEARIGMTLRAKLLVERFCHLFGRISLCQERCRPHTDLIVVGNDV